MDRAGGMENAHETLAAQCTAVEARFPHRLGRHKTPPTRSTGKIAVLFEHDVTGRTRAPVAKPMGGNSPKNVAALRRAFTFAGIRVHVPRIRRSTSPECAGRPCRLTPSRRDKSTESDPASAGTTTLYLPRPKNGTFLGGRSRFCGRVEVSARPHAGNGEKRPGIRAYPAHRGTTAGGLWSTTRGAETCCTESAAFARFGKMV